MNDNNIKVITGKHFKKIVLKRIENMEFPNGINSTKISIEYRSWDGPLEQIEFQID